MDEALMNEVVTALLHKNSGLAAQVLSDFLEDGNQGGFLEALREMTMALGGVSKMAEQSGLTPEQLSHMLSGNGDHLLGNLSAILKVMGMQFGVRSLHS